MVLLGHYIWQRQRAVKSIVCQRFQKSRPVSNNDAGCSVTDIRCRRKRSGSANNHRHSKTHSRKFWRVNRRHRREKRNCFNPRARMGRDTALDPGGVCERVKHFAKASRLGITLIQVGLDEKRARGMHEARSIAALKMADHMLAIWDGSSKGTAGEIKLAKKMGVPTTIIRLEPRPKPNLAALDFDMQDMSALLDDLTASGQMGDRQ